MFPRFATPSPISGVRAKNVPQLTKKEIGLNIAHAVTYITDVGVFKSYINKIAKEQGITSREALDLAVKAELTEYPRRAL